MSGWMGTGRKPPVPIALGPAARRASCTRVRMRAGHTTGSGAPGRRRHKLFEVQLVSNASSMAAMAECDPQGPAVRAGNTREVSRVYEVQLTQSGAKSYGIFDLADPLRCSRRGRIPRWSSRRVRVRLDARRIRSTVERLEAAGAGGEDARRREQRL